MAIFWPMDLEVTVHNQLAYCFGSVGRTVVMMQKPPSITRKKKKKKKVLKSHRPLQVLASKAHLPRGSASQHPHSLLIVPPCQAFHALVFGGQYPNRCTKTDYSWETANSWEWRGLLWWKKTVLETGEGCLQQSESMETKLCFPCGTCWHKAHQNTC